VCDFTLNEQGFGLAFVAKDKDGNTVGIIGDAQPSKAEMTRFLKALVERLGDEASTPEENQVASDVVQEVASAAASEASNSMARFADQQSAA
jgi:hypothetical protein